MGYRVKLAVFVLNALFVLFLLNIAFQGLNVLRRLEVVESERDQWQRSVEIIRALDLRQDGKVVDLGCGSGYFALKLASAVDSGGRVFAVDIRRFPLCVLWVRAAIRRLQNLEMVNGEAPEIPFAPGTLNAVLVANTFHEMARPGITLDAIFRWLTPGGRLVVVDPNRTEHGNESPDLIEEELRSRGFEIISRDDQFVNQPSKGPWWLLVACKPR